MKTPSSFHQHLLEAFQEYDQRNKPVPSKENLINQVCSTLLARARSGCSTANFVGCQTTNPSRYFQLKSIWESVQKYLQEAGLAPILHCSQRRLDANEIGDGKGEILYSLSLSVEKLREAVGMTWDGKNWVKSPD